MQTVPVHVKEEIVQPPPVVRPRSPTPPPPQQNRPPVAIPKRVPPQIFRPPTPPLATHYVKKRSADPIGVEMTSYMKPRELHTIYPDTSHSEKQLPRPSVVSTIIQRPESAGTNSLTSKPSRALHTDTISSETHNVSFNPRPPVARKRPPPERALPRPPSTSSSSPSSTRSSRSWSKYLQGSEAPLHENLHTQALTNATSNRDAHRHPHPRGTHSHGHHSERRLTRVSQAPPMRRSKTEKSGLGIVRTVSYPPSGFWQHIETMAKSMLEKFRRWTQPSM
ncbi:hypothetical protein BD410DRAFT_28978 [Rickenella mellea]|uniref:Uncharacterized protein n=1 Tax=Rickenella mellea TaxID=50990 RepID=A0A4V3AZL2_9AGAM|nr:hypothetical protein BD410DRAFT_28978 [Rickenella mellea]